MNTSRRLIPALFAAAVAGSCPLFAADAPANTTRPTPIATAPQQPAPIAVPVAKEKPAKGDRPALNATRLSPSSAGVNAVIDVAGAGKTEQGQGLKPGKPKGPKVGPAGTWTWTTRNRNGQPIENKLTVSVDKQGVITGTLSDRSGEHPITNATVKDDVLTFTVLHQSPGIGDVPVDYSVNLDGNDLKVAVERPDSTPEGKATGRKRKTEAAAKHAAAAAAE